MAQVKETGTAVALLPATLGDIPGIERDRHGKPLLPLQPAVLYRFGHLVRLSEQLLLDLFGKGLLSGVYGWAGAAGTVAFADVNTGLRGGLFTQYMPSSAYPLTEEFAEAMLGDALAGRASG